MKLSVKQPVSDDMPCSGNPLFTVLHYTASLGQSSINQKGSKVTKRTPPTKKVVHPPPSPTGKENADTTPDLKDLEQKKGLADRPKRRRRVHFNSPFERKKPTLVLTSVQPG